MAANDISPAKRMPAWRMQLSAFWRWWSGELIQLLPERIAALGGTRKLPVARRELVDAKVQRLRDLGVAVQGVTVRDERGHPAAELELLPDETLSGRDSARERYILWGAIGAVVVLLATALLLPVYHKR